MDIGYACGSREDQNWAIQHQALVDANCAEILTDLNAAPGSGLKRALEVVSKGDCLVIYRLDALPYAVPTVLKTLSSLRERGAAWRSLDDNLDTTSDDGQTIDATLAALARLDQQQTSARAKAALRSTTGRRGKKPGPARRLSPHQIEHARRMIESGQETATAMAELYGISRVTLWRSLKNVA